MAFSFLPEMTRGRKAELRSSSPQSGLCPELGIEFARRRYAAAILAGDDATGDRLRQQLDQMLNGKLARAGSRF